MGVFVLRGICFITQNYGIVIFWGGELNVFQVAEGQRKTEVLTYGQKIPNRMRGSHKVPLT